MGGRASSPALQLDTNNRYLLKWARELAPGRSLLDYGCGDGDLVVAAREEGIDAYGTEKFHIVEGPATKAAIESDPTRAGAIRELDGDTIPWPDASFDLVLSNQVFEHVDDLELVVGEIDRVVKPGGRLLALYPTRETLREAHIGIPLSHWFPPGEARQRYTTALRSAGLGRSWGEGDQTAAEWSRETLAWIDTYVRYRPRSETFRILRRHFALLEPVEWDYAAFRLGPERGRLASSAALRPVVRTAIRALATTAVLATKSQ